MRLAISTVAAALVLACPGAHPPNGAPALFVFCVVQVQWIYLVVPIVMCLGSTLGTKVSKYMGRVQTVLALRSMGLTFFSGMIVLYKYSIGGSYSNWLVVGACILCTALMNCTYPIEEGILMDYAPKKDRAKWNSLESISEFGWCGSAFAGGLLADAYGYTFACIITILAQATATLC